jgi:hypothetical protein
MAKAGITEATVAKNIPAPAIFTSTVPSLTPLYTMTAFL